MNPSFEIRSDNEIKTITTDNVLKESQQIYQEFQYTNCRTIITFSTTLES